MAYRMLHVSILPLLWLLAWPPPAAQAQSSRTQDAEGFEVHTTPPGAQVFVNWDLLGTTPLVVSGERLRADDLFVAWLPEHRASYRQVLKPRSLYLRLDTESSYPLQRILLRVIGDDTHWFDDLTAALSSARFFVHPMEDTEALEHHILALGNRSAEPLLAWARSRFETAYWLVIRLPGTDPRLDLAERLQPDKAVAPENPTATSNAADSSPDPTLELRLVNLRDASTAFQAQITARHIDHSSTSRRAKARQQAVQDVLENLTTWVGNQEPAPEVVSVIDTDEAKDDQGPDDRDAPSTSGSLPKDPPSR